MVGLIFKIGGFFVGLIAVILVILNMTNVWNPGTLAWSPPSVDACHRYLAQYYKDKATELVEVRWIMTMKNYGWGCYIEFTQAFDVITVSPMPE